MRKNKFLAALAIAACLATSVPFSVNAATPGQATDASKVKYGTVSTANQAVLKQLFDATYYKKNNPDLAAAGITTDDALFNHFVKCGVFEGRACCEGFNVSAYRCYPDLQAAFGDDIVAYYVHWKNFGQTEKRTLVTVEAAAAAGYTVKGVDGAVVSAPAAASTSTAAASTATSTEEKVAEDAEAAKLAKNVLIDEVTGKFYDSSKGDDSKVSNALGVLDGYVAVGGKYFATVDKDAAFTYDAEKYGKTKKDGKDVYYDLTVVAVTDAVKAGIPDNKVLVDGKYYDKATKEQAYSANENLVANTINTGYVAVYDSDNGLHYFVSAVADGVGYSIAAKGKTLKDDNGAFHEYVADYAAGNFSTYYNELNTEKYGSAVVNTKNVIYSLSPVYDWKAASVVDPKYTKYKSGYLEKSVSANGKPSNYVEKLETGNYVWLEADQLRYKFVAADDADRVLDADKYVGVAGKYYAIAIADVDTKINKDNAPTYYNLTEGFIITGGKVYRSSGLNGEDAVKADIAEKKAADGYVDFSSADGLKKFPNSGLTGIHKEVAVDVAYTFDSNKYAKSGDTYYVKGNGSTEAEVKTFIPKDGYILGADLEYHKIVDTATVYVLDTKNYGETKVYGKSVYYSKEAVDASVATGTVKVAAEGYVLVKEVAYPEVKFEDAFEKKEGYKVTKNAEDGLYYYTK